MRFEKKKEFDVFERKKFTIVRYTHPLLDGSGVRGRRQQTKAHHERGDGERGVIFAGRRRRRRSPCRCRVVPAHDRLERFGRHCIAQQLRRRIVVSLVYSWRTENVFPRETDGFV